MLVADALEQAGFSNAFSTRQGGVSPFPDGDLNLSGFDEDTAENIHENRRRFLATFDRDFRLATVWQTHGDDIKLVAGENDVTESGEKHDALISRMTGVLVGVKTADCVPVLLGDPATGAFAAVHAGWRGTAKKIVMKAVERMQQEFGTDPADLIVAIGPAANDCCYEVGSEVIDALGADEKYFTATVEGHARVDLPRANRDQLIASGVLETSISAAPLCTIDRTDLFFSYRAEKKLYGRAGRLLSVVGRAA